MGKDSVQLKSIEAEEPTESDGNGGNKIEKGGKLEREDGERGRARVFFSTLKHRVEQTSGYFHTNRRQYFPNQV